MIKLTPRPPSYPPPWRVLAAAGWNATQMWTLYSSWNRKNHQEQDSIKTYDETFVARANYKEDHGSPVSNPACATSVGETVARLAKFDELNT